VAAPVVEASPPPPPPTETVPAVDPSAISLLLQQLAQGSSLGVQAPPPVPQPYPSYPVAYPDNRSPAPQYYQRAPSPPRQERRFSPPQRDHPQRDYDSWQRRSSRDEEPAFKRRRSRSPSPRRGRPPIPERSSYQPPPQDEGWGSASRSSRPPPQPEAKPWASEEPPAPKPTPITTFTRKPDDYIPPVPVNQGHALRQVRQEEPVAEPQAEPATRFEAGFSVEGPSFLTGGPLPDFSDFDATSPVTWEKMGRTWAKMFGFVPTNEQIISLFFMCQSMSHMSSAGAVAGMGSSMNAGEVGTAPGAPNRAEAPGQDDINDMDMSDSGDEAPSAPPHEAPSFAEAPQSAPAAPVAAKSTSRGGKMRKVNGGYVFVQE
jgi:hypothetical protein